MNKKTIYISFALIIALTIYIIYLYSNDNPVSIKKPNSNFAIENPEIITRIVIDDITNETADLRLENGEWIVNNKFKAKPENIELILSTVKDIEVQRNVPKASIQPVITDIAAMHKKVEFYENNNLIKTYYIGNPTQDHFGTYMLLETPSEGRSSVPYITHIPGFNGFLSTRFFGNEDLWKYSGVFNYEISNIQEIKVEHTNNPNESFLLKNIDTSFNLFGLQGNQLNKRETLVKNYVLNYKKIHYNMIMNYSQSQIDSVKNLSPHYIVSVKDNLGSTKELKIWKMAPKKNDIDPVTNKQREWDVNHALACLNDANEILKFQYYTLDKILVEKSYLAQ